MMLSVVLSISFVVNKMILKYQSGRKHEFNERHDETSREGIVSYSKSKPDDFHVRYEHMIGLILD